MTRRQLQTSTKAKSCLSKIGRVLKCELVERQAIGEIVDGRWQVGYRNAGNYKSLTVIGKAYLRSENPATIPHFTRASLITLNKAFSVPIIQNKSSFYPNHFNTNTFSDVYNFNKPVSQAIISYKKKKKLKWQEANCED